MGAAFASLCALELTLELRLPVEVYSFGSPRFGNHAFAKLYDATVPSTFRVCFDQDFVTTFPKFFCMYKHVGLEVIIDSIGNFIVDPIPVEKLLKKSRRSVSHHKLMNYMNGLHRACDNHNLGLDFVPPPESTFADDLMPDMYTEANLGIDSDSNTSSSSSPSSDGGRRYRKVKKRQEEKQREDLRAPLLRSSSTESYGAV